MGKNFSEKNQKDTDSFGEKSLFLPRCDIQFAEKV